MAWVDVKQEMTEVKGLDPAVADKIGEYVKHKGPSHCVHHCVAFTNLIKRRTIIIRATACRRGADVEP